MTPQTADQPPTSRRPAPAKVTIATELATVTAEAREPLAVVHRLAVRAHAAAAKRAAAAKAATPQRVVGY
ncbi:hypothetical protein [Micromonospora sp. RTGN7]|uniref:hypothetical protein n=1 Tax=Micromonospora sp. RTGN7 TaxID=3016526 RepID=UPI0029FF3B92|nr:hypothetical protein [Micromonospora sp. RTGN7]